MNDMRRDEDVEGRDELPERLLAIAKEHNAPPRTPRDEIWARIQAKRQVGGGAEHDIPVLHARKTSPSTRFPARRLVLWGAGIAALLVLGIGIGRMTSPAAPGGTDSTPLATDTPGREPARAGLAYTLATLQHLGRVESFLVALRNSPGDLQFSNQARDLLTSTRLLIDVPDLDPRLQSLLGDLEDILVQIVQFDSTRGSQDLDLITEGLERRQVLPRLRTALPAEPGRAL